VVARAQIFLVEGSLPADEGALGVPPDQRQLDRAPERMAAQQRHGGADDQKGRRRHRLD